MRRKLIGWIRNFLFFIPKKNSNLSMPKIIKILIWGCNDFSATLLKLLEDSSVEVVGFIDTRTETQFNNKPVFNPEVFRDIDEYKSIPIVIAVSHHVLFGVPWISFEPIRLFKLMLVRIVEEYKIENELLHPSALVDFFPVNAEGKIITFGTQGSGNGVYNNVFQMIFDQYCPPRQEQRTLFFAKMAKEYMVIISQTFQDILQIHGGREVSAIPWKMGTTCVAATFLNNTQMTIFSFHTREHLSSSVYGYHNLASEAYLSKLVKMNFKLILYVRNPLDIILSSLNKWSRFNGDIKEFNWHDFCCTTVVILTKLQKWYELKKNLTILRYEDLINQPEEKIIELMRMAGFKPSRKFSKKVWSSIGFKQLPSTPRNHFWRGGSGKWEVYFKKEHLLYLKKAGVEDLLEKFGYSDELIRFRALISEIQDQDIAQMENDEIPKIGFCEDEHDNTYEYLRLHRVADGKSTKIGPFVIQCEDEGLLSKMQNSLDNPYLIKLATCGVYNELRFN